MNILCCGLYPALQRTLHLPGLHLGRVNRVRCTTQTVGGKAVNAARVLQTLGAAPLLTGFRGGDTGKTVCRLLDEEGIAHHFVETEAATRLCQTLLADTAEDFTELVEEGPRLPSGGWKKLLREFQTLEKSSVIISGTLPDHAPKTIYAELIEAADAPVILDTSGPALAAALKAQPDLVKINASELRKTTGIENLEEAARELAAQGAKAVGITQGAGSALLVTSTQSIHFSMPAVDVKSTLGCGDSVNAGIAFALQTGSALPEAFVFGLACGAANAQTSLPGVIHPDQLEGLVKQIRMN